MIATAKMKRAQEQALAGRPYSDKITQVIADLAAEFAGDGAVHPLLEKEKRKQDSCSPYHFRQGPMRWAKR